MQTTYQDNGNGTFTATTTDVQPFSPSDIRDQISTLQARMAAAIELAISNVNAQFEPQIAALQAQLDAFTSQIPNPSTT